MKQRLSYIDIAKGIGILLMVLGHNHVATAVGKVYTTIYSFHLPLFFFLSGIFFTPHQPFRQMLIKKGIALWQPYLVTLWLFSPIYLLFIQPVPVVKYFAATLYGTSGTIYWTDWTPLWFLPHLFALHLYCWVVFEILHLTSDSRKQGLALIVVSFPVGVALFECVSSGRLPFVSFDIPFLQALTRLPGLPWSSDLVVATSCFFLAGFYLKPWLNSGYFHSTAALIAGLGLFGGFHYFYDMTINYNARLYDHLIFSTCIAFLGIYLTLSIAHRIARRDNWLTHMLIRIGEYSLFILIFHWFIQRYSYTIFSKIFPASPILPSLISFVLGASIPVLLADICRRLPVVRRLYFPGYSPSQKGIGTNSMPTDNTNERKSTTT